MATIVKLPDSTIQLIAAGEVITRPVNVVKELLENSLDAGATNIRITIEQGGLKLIQIVDNGHGISKSNAELLCQRYSTSKLSVADDLTRISTFGFRGEALASVSEVACIEVKTFNMETDDMGWQARYNSGKLSTFASRYLPNPGTKLRVTDLFSTIRNRKTAMQASFVEEKKSIIDLIMRYAIHHRETVTMSLKECDSPDLICLLAPMDIKSCMGMFFGLEVENNLFELRIENSHQYKVEAHVVFSYSYKKLISNHQSSIFILFVNGRLVECSELKREVEALAHEHLGKKGSVPLFCIDLKVPPSDVDVNTHPAKASVTLHYQDEITALLITSLRVKLKEKLADQSACPNASQQKTIGQILRSPSQPTDLRNRTTLPISPLNQQRLCLLAPGSVSNFVSSSPVVNSPNIVAKRPHELIHNDSSQQTLGQLSGANKTRPRTNRAPSHEAIRPWPGIENLSSPTPTVVISSTCSDITDINHDYLMPIESPPLMAPQRERRELRLRSISQLRQLVAKEKSSDTAKTIKNSTFVGLFDHDRALIQHETKLYAINLKSYLKEQYYQFYLFDFASFPPIEVLPPGNKIQYIIDTYLEDIRKHEPSKFKKLKFNTPSSIVDELLKHSAMFEDYLSLSLTKDEIRTLPCILPDEVPNLTYLGRFLVDMANFVDYTEERECLRSIGRRIADFYSEAPANLKDKSVHRRYHDLVETKLYVAIKNYLLIPEWLFTRENICQISDTKDLYKVFERC